MYRKSTDLETRSLRTSYDIVDNLKRLREVIEQNSLYLGHETVDLVRETERLVKLMQKAFAQKLNLELAEIKEMIEDIDAEELKARMLDSQQDWLIATLPPFGNSEIEEGE